MSDTAAQELIQDAIKDDDFRQKLVDDFEGAIEGRDLTPSEIEALRSLDWSHPLPNDTRVMGSWVHIYKTAPVM